MSAAPGGAATRLAARLLGAALNARPEPPAPADAVVVLGTAIGPGGEPSLQGEERARVAAEIYHRGLAPVVCAVGGHCPRRHRRSRAEAEGMGPWLLARGVPREALRVDRLSYDTASNAARAAAILLPEGRRRVWLVTQPFHLRRARLWFRRAGLEPLGWFVEDSVQFRRHDAALRWMTRECASWALVPPRLLWGAVARR
ncbi:MAG TPA: YdcF family protein [Polyangiaceae bacterium]|nr:YdcF family protein [Polyangiaceae bacterium]